RLRYGAGCGAARALAADRRVPGWPGAVGQPVRAPGVRRAAPAPWRSRRDLLPHHRHAVRAGRGRGRAGAGGPHGGSGWCPGGAGASGAGAGPALRDHGLVIGYGVTGQAVARVLRETGVPFVAVDMVADVVDAGRREGISVRFGDASRRGVLEEMGAERARAA